MSKFKKSKSDIKSELKRLKRENNALSNSRDAMYDLWQQECRSHWHTMQELEKLKGSKKDQLIEKIMNIEEMTLIDDDEEETHPSHYRLAPLLNRIPAGYIEVIEVSEGWHPIIIELDKQIAAIHPDYKIHQVKEKFGGLRYYTNVVDAEVGKLIAEAEKKSFKTCEQCGEPGELRKGGWLITLCDECSK